MTSCSVFFSDGDWVLVVFVLHLLLQTQFSYNLDGICLLAHKECEDVRKQPVNMNRFVKNVNRQSVKTEQTTREDLKMQPMKTVSSEPLEAVEKQSYEMYFRV